MNRKYDRDVWAPPLPHAQHEASPTALTKFQQHFQNRISLVGKDGSNGQLVAVEKPKLMAATQPSHMKPVSAPVRMAIVAPGERLRGTAFAQRDPLLPSMVKRHRLSSADISSSTPIAPSPSAFTLSSQNDVRPSGVTPTIKSRTSSPSSSPRTADVDAILRRRVRHPSSGQRLLPIAWESPKALAMDTAGESIVARHCETVAVEATRSPPPTTDLGAESHGPQFRSTGTLSSLKGSKRPATTADPGDSTPPRKACSSPTVPGTSIGAKKDPKKANRARCSAEDEAAPATSERKRVVYKPHTLREYQALRERDQHAKLPRGLGPTDSDEQRLARERKQRKAAYAERIEREMLQQVNRRAGESASDPIPILQPPPKERLEALERRERARAYAEAAIQKEREEQLARGAVKLAGTPAAGEVTKEMLRVAPLTAQEVAAAERTQRLLDLEALHAQGKEAVAAIRRQWEVRT